MGLGEDRKRLQKKTAAMMRRVQVPAAKINKIKVQAASGLISTNAQWAAARRDVKKAYDEIDKIFESYSVSAIPQSYRFKVKAEVRKMRKIKVPEVQKKIPNIVLDSQFHKGAIKVLTDDTIEIYAATVDEGLKMTGSLLRKTQQTIATESRLNLSIAEGLSTKGTVQETKNRILIELKKELTEPYVLKAGSRRYRAETYAELVAQDQDKGSPVSSHIKHGGGCW